MKEAASSEGHQMLASTLTYRNSLERPRSVPMQPYLGSVILCLINTCLGSKFFRAFTRIVGKVYNLCRVKTNRLAVLTVKNGLDSYMIIELEDDLNQCLFMLEMITYDIVVTLLLLGLMV